MSDPLAGPLASSSPVRSPAPRAGLASIGDATHPPIRDEQLPSRQHGRDASRRVGRRELVQLAERLNDRDRRIIEAVDKLRLVRADQLRRLFFSELTTEGARARLCRRSLQRLTETGLLRPLERRIGGNRAGSSGRVYTLAPAGRRLLAHWRGLSIASDRGVHEPGLLFAAHTLAIADLYVTLVEAERAGRVELLSFDPEPVRTYTSTIGGTSSLKPDAHVQLGIGDYEHVSFCELDCGTEGRGALERKIHAYLNLYRSGREQTEHGLFPRVVWITPNPDRAAYISALVDALPPDAQELFAVTTSDHVLAVLAAADTPGPAEGEA